MQATPGDKREAQDGERLAAVLTAFGAAPRPATVIAVTLGPAQRMGRAARILGICWALAVAAVFLPVLHFLLVPGLLLAGPVLAGLGLRHGRRLVRVDGVCPRCGVRQSFEPGGAVRPRRTIDCSGCRTELTLTLAETTTPRSAAGG